MNSDRWRGVPEQPAGADAVPLWSVSLPPDGCVLSALPGGGCLVTTTTSISAIERDGVPRWSNEISDGGFGRALIALADGEFVRIENHALVTRALATGHIVKSVPASGAAKLSIAAWGDLLCSRTEQWSTASVDCVSPTGSLRWSIAIDDSPPSYAAPLTLGEVVVIARRGLLWAYDRMGRGVWVADHAGLREPRPADEHRRPKTVDQDGGVELFGTPVRLDHGRALVALRSYSLTRLYLVDGIAARLTPLDSATRPIGPFTALPHPPTEFQITRFAGQITVGDMDWRYLVASYDLDGQRLWEHRLPAEPIQLDSTPNGTLLATATASTKRWRDYGPYYGTEALARETFVRCINPDGTSRWTWRAHGPITHPPVVDSNGTVYLVADQKLWALPNQ